MRRWKFLVAAVLVVLAAVLAWHQVVTRGYTLEHGSSSWHGADAETITDGATTDFRYAFSPGGQVTFGVSVRNPGPWQVTITGLTVDDSPEPVFKTARVAVSPMNNSIPMFDPAAATPLGSRTLDAGMELSALVTITIPDVEQAAGAGLRFERIAVDYDVLGVHRHQWVPMGFGVFVYSANGYVPG